MLRYEYKYFVPLEKLQTLRKLIQPFMEPDSHIDPERGEYTVRSIYFDTKNLECYQQKIFGVKRRNKVRLRGYDAAEDHHAVFMEIKRKIDEPLLKNRASFDYSTAQTAIQKGYLPEEELKASSDFKNISPSNARRFLYHLNARQMFPVVTVIYEREPWQSILKDTINDFRITFDKNLRAIPFPAVNELFEEKNARPVMPGWFILEVKFNRYLPAWANAIITSLGLKKGPASKYVLCVNACPEIFSGRDSIRFFQKI